MGSVKHQPRFQFGEKSPPRVRFTNVLHVERKDPGLLFWDLFPGLGEPVVFRPFSNAVGKRSEGSGLLQNGGILTDSAFEDHLPQKIKIKNVW